MYVQTDRLCLRIFFHSIVFFSLGICPIGYAFFSPESHAGEKIGGKWRKKKKKKKKKKEKKEQEEEGEKEEEEEEKVFVLRVIKIS